MSGSGTCTFHLVIMEDKDKFFKNQHFFLLANASKEKGHYCFLPQSQCWLSTLGLPLDILQKSTMNGVYTCGLGFCR